jgi:predicted GIY-YIG superfamily endonuclease
MDYSKGKIYKIIDESNGDLYIGSTIQTLKARNWGHHMIRDYNKIRENCKISLIEDYPCNSKKELVKREQYWIDRTDCINKTRSYRTPGQKKESMRNHKEMNRERCLLLQKKSNERSRTWQRSMGGRKDEWNNNSLVKIDPDIFT